MDKRWIAPLPLLAALCVGATPCGEAPSAPAFPYRLTAIEEGPVEGDEPGALFARLERQDLALWLESGAVLEGQYLVDRVDELEIEVTDLDLGHALVVALEEEAAGGDPPAQPEIFVPWSGGPLPPEALEPPDGTLVNLLAPDSF